ncbi:phage integrase central domain-containing protein [Ralstonia sp. Ralssp110]|uniref:phage integrase central domain-containing protein n=1 Tax=Ralstonia sp. Ralssp110 TaxID=3243004 RepID=UPI0039B6C8AA
MKRTRPTLPLQPRRSLVEQISAPVETVADLLDKMPYDGISQSTRKTWLTLDKTIRAAIGDVPCHELTTKQCAAVLLPYREAGKARMAQSLRSRLIAMCTEGMGLGWTKTRRARLSGSMSPSSVAD